MSDVLLEKINQILEQNRDQNQKIDDIHKVIYGNGDPEKGIVVKMTRTNECLKSVTSTLRIHWVLISAIFLSILGLCLRVFI